MGWAPSRRPTGWRSRGAAWRAACWLEQRADPGAWPPARQVFASLIAFAAVLMGGGETPLEDVPSVPGDWRAWGPSNMRKHSGPWAAFCPSQSRPAQVIIWPARGSIPARTAAAGAPWWDEVSPRALRRLRDRTHPGRTGFDRARRWPDPRRTWARSRSRWPVRRWRRLDLTTRVMIVSAPLCTGLVAAVSGATRGNRPTSSPQGRYFFVALVPLAMPPARMDVEGRRTITRPRAEWHRGHAPRGLRAGGAIRN